MHVQTGYLYHIKDEFFEKINDGGLMINHEKGHSRPSYLAIKDNNILWFIPLSTKIEKYKSIIENKVKKALSESTLTAQSYLLDDSKNVGQVLKEKGASVTRFVRYFVGEGIEKRVDNFAEEVMKEIK